MNPIKIAIAEDHTLYLNGLVSVLEDLALTTLCGTAPNGSALLELVEKNLPEVIFMDIQMPVLNGIDATRVLQQRHPQVKVLALTQYEDAYSILEMMKAGARGYLLKNSTETVLAGALQAMRDGGYFYCPQTSRRLTQLLAKEAPSSPPLLLTPTEKAILRYICEDLSTKQIGPLLHLSNRTIEWHRRCLLEKTGSRNRVGLVVYAIRNGLLTEKDLFL